MNIIIIGPTCNKWPQKVQPQLELKLDNAQTFMTIGVFKAIVHVFGVSCVYVCISHLTYWFAVSHCQASLPLND